MPDLHQFSNTKLSQIEGIQCPTYIGDFQYQRLYIHLIKHKGIILSKLI